MTYLVAALLAAITALMCVIWILIVNKNKQTAVPTDTQIAETFSAAAARLLDLSEGEDIYKAIADEIHKVCGNAFVLVNSFDKTYDKFSSKTVSGVNSLVQKGLEMLGPDYLKASFKMDDEAKKILTSGHLKEVEGGLYRVSFGKVPKEICEEIEHFFKIGKVYAMGFARKGGLFGNVIIIPIFGNISIDKKTIEASINLASIALYNKLGSN